MSRTQFTLSALLLASAAVIAAPTLAQDRHPGGDDRGNRAGAVHDGRGDGADHAGGRTHGEQPAPAPAPAPPRQAPPQVQSRQAQPQAQSRQPAPQARPQFQPRQVDQNQVRNDRGNFDRGNGGWQQRGGDPRDNAGRHVQGRDANGVQVWRNDDRGQAQRQDWQNNNRDNGRPGGWDQNRQAGGDRDRHDGWAGNNHQGGWDRNDHDRGGNWNSGWRNDRRYDWQGWRNSHRDTYRAGQYRVPYGYHGGYHRWGIGVRIDPIFFGQDYWIDNPDYYRLPPAYDDYRWVRYYNDALLIDIYSGTVVDEIPDFFW